MSYVKASSFAALLVDLENLYRAMADRFVNPADLTMTALGALREHLVEERGLSPVVGRAYAPFDYSASRVFVNDLALMGITPVHVLAHASKNSADLMLAIDAMELLFRRSDIGTFVIVGGDRDYIPVAERIRQNGKQILVVSPPHAVSGDLITIVGRECFLDPVELLPEGRARPVKRASDNEAATGQGDQDPSEETIPAKPAAQATRGERDVESVERSRREIPSSMAEVEAAVTDPDELEDLKRCTGALLSFRAGRKIHDVWMGPFLRVMNDLFPLKNNVERKDLLSRLADLGAIDIEERPRNDDGGTYAVMIINWKHPLIVQTNPG